MAELDVRTRHRAAGDYTSDMIDAGPQQEDGETGHPMDRQAARDELRMLLEWFYTERDRQVENRMEMAMDADFYDGIQWDPDDAAALAERGQMPLVYNEIAPMVDWLIGTERRTKVDWNVLPRAEDDVKLADVKRQVLKYVADVNRTQFARSRGFTDAVKVGVGWVDDGARDDPTQDVLYSKYEDWRNVIWDSSSYELDLSDARYVFRWRWVDEDIALATFKGREDIIRQAVEDQGADWYEAQDDTWYLGEHIEKSGKLLAAGTAGMNLNNSRRRVKLIECQYRKPAVVQIVADGPHQGAFLHDKDLTLVNAVQQSGSSITERVVMRVHVAVFTEAAMLAYGPSIYRHNRFSLTPIWCYRRSRDRLPYGVIRRVRDIQQDLNKRASKALFMLNTNQIIADEGAVENWQHLREEADRPDGMLVKKAGKELRLQRDTDAATGQIQMMTLAAQSIQKTAGVNNENLGRQTNAVSGAAIEARQNQGAVGTTEPFDNLRLAVQVQGEKQLSLTEQFYTEAKVLRLTGAKGAIEWLKVNEQEQLPDGSVRILNDITASMADFVVSDADYAGTLRHVMFDSLNVLVQKLPPDVGLRIFTIAMEFSDLPNKDEIAESIRGITGERDPNKELSPDEQQQEEQNAMLQAEAMQMQRDQAMLALEEQRAKVRELNAKAAEIEARAPGNHAMGAELGQVRSDLSNQVDDLSRQLQQAQQKLANETIRINKEADVKAEVARIEADAKIRVAEIQKESNDRLAVFEARLNELDGQQGGPGNE